MKLNVVYFGSSYFSALLLERIIKDQELQKTVNIQLVVTQPDKPVGRRQVMTSTPVKEVGKKYQIKVAESSQNLTDSFDLGLVYAYGEIIPEELLKKPKYGFLNIHPSLLPKYRGTAPIAAPLIEGEKTTGVTIIQMDEKIDHGPIVAQEKCEILRSHRRPDLEIKLTELGFEMFKKLIKKGSPWRAFHQDHSVATYTKKLTKQDGYIDFENLKYQIGSSGEKLFNLFRGLYPWPGIWTVVPSGKRLKIIDVYLKEGKLSIKKVQLEGKKEVDFETFNKAYKIF